MATNRGKEATARSLEENFALQVAQLCQIYGIPAKYGRLYATLFLTPRAMSLTELAERSDTAKSTTSTALRSLERYRFVRRLPRGSDRQDYYEVVADPTQILRDWVRLFLGPELAVGAKMADELDVGIGALVKSAGYQAEEKKVLEERAAVMRRALGEGEQLMQMLLAILEAKAN
jgi:DNA-binding transcriptional regulator GbsR (MarR family)